MSRWICKTIAAIGVVVCLCSLFTLGGTAFAASPSTINFAPLQKTCALLHVHLDGYQHTITCLSSRSTTNPNAKISPELVRTACTWPMNIYIENYGNSFVCFDGGGYLGVQIYNVNDVTNVSDDIIPLQEPMWIRWYSPGTYCTIQPGVNKHFGDGGHTGIEVTQLDWGATNGGNC